MNKRIIWAFVVGVLVGGTVAGGATYFGGVSANWWMKGRYHMVQAERSYVWRLDTATGKMALFTINQGYPYRVINNNLAPLDDPW